MKSNHEETTDMLAQAGMLLTDDEVSEVAGGYNSLDSVYGTYKPQETDPCSRASGTLNGVHSEKREMLSISIPQGVNLPEEQENLYHGKHNRIVIRDFPETN